MGNKNVGKVVVIPITKGQTIKDGRGGRRAPEIKKDSPEVRRLLQCLEMLSELARDVAKTQ